MVHKSTHILGGIALVLATSSLAGCGSSSDDNYNSSELSELILENQTAWQSLALTSYSYTYDSYLSDCSTADQIGSITVIVEDSVVVDAYYESYGESFTDLENIRTIDEVFDYMQEVLEFSPKYFGLSSDEPKELPEFDSSFYYPSEFYFDDSDDECDAITYRISNFF